MASATSTQRHNRTPGINKQSASRRFPDGSWVVRYRDAENHTRRRTFGKKQHALDFQASVRTDKNRGDFINLKEAATPFGQVTDSWFASLQVRPKTAAGYRSILDAHLLPEFGLRPIGRINAAEIQRFLAKSGRSPGTQRNILRVMSPIMKHAIQAKMIRVNPCGLVRLPKVTRKEMLHLDAAEVRTLADAITPEYRTLILTAAYTGMRAGELTALRVKHLDLKRGRAKVAESVSDVRGKLHFGPPKNGRTRMVPLTPFLVVLLREQIAGKRQDDLVFTGPTGAPLRHSNYYGRHFKRAVREALPDKLDLRFHDLRHTCASLLIQQNMHPKAVADWLGHSSIAITMDRYGHLYDDHAQPIVDGLEAAFRSVRTQW